MESSPRSWPVRNRVLLYLMIVKAARDFGLTHAEIAAVAGRFDPARPRCSELADALADLILARVESGRLGQAPADGGMF
jgi:hypothetical protein